MHSGVLRCLSITPRVQRMSTSPDDIPEFAQVIIKAFLQKIRQAFDLLMLGTSLPVLLVPLLFALFAFSTPQTRRSIMFKKCVIDVLLGLATSIYGVYVEVSLQLPVAMDVSL
jgi:hypothetical protein